MTFEQVKLGDVADMLSGFAFKSAEFLDHAEQGVLLVRGDNVQQGFIRWGEKAKKWRSDAYDDLSRYHLQKDDVILAMDRPIVGGGLKLAWIKDQDLPSLLVQRVTRIRGFNDKARTNFLRYVLSTPGFLAHIDRITTGANIPHISGKDIASFTFQLPDLDVQDRIVDFIAAYDDLIENNQRRIALLEESAHLLYREWFLKLRFPGHESYPSVGGIPEGWARKSIADMVQINPKVAFEKERIYPFVPMQALSECSMLIEDTEERAISGGAKFQNQDTLLARITPCLENGKTGFVQFLEEDKPVASGSTEFIVMRSESVSPYWVYCTARDEGFRKHAIGSMVGSDGRQRVNLKCFDSYFAFQPPENVLNDFDEKVEPMFKEIQLLSRMNQRLREARDALLPKLMSGEIQV